MAALIATYQFSVLASFLSAANVAARYVDGQVWVMARGVPAFDFAYAIERDYRGSLQRFFPGATSREVVSGFGLWNAPSGAKSTLAVVGVEDYPLHRRYHEDFLTLIGLGYDTRYIGTVLAVVALSFALLAMVVASASLPAVIVMTEAIVPWVEYQAVSILFGVILALLAAFTAYRGARNQVRSLNLEEVFRS